jgi:hypothetical protein
VADKTIISTRVCGPSRMPICKCQCPEGPCEHRWDGPIEEQGSVTTVTCSRCGMSAFSHSMWVGP